LYNALRNISVHDDRLNNITTRLQNFELNSQVLSNLSLKMMTILTNLRINTFVSNIHLISCKKLSCKKFLLPKEMFSGTQYCGKKCVEK